MAVASLSLSLVTWGCGQNESPSDGGSGGGDSTGDGSGGTDDSASGGAGENGSGGRSDGSGGEGGAEPSLKDALLASPNACDPPCEKPERCYSNVKVPGGNGVPEILTYFCADPDDVEEAQDDSPGDPPRPTTECQCSADEFCVIETDPTGVDVLNEWCVNDPGTCTGARNCACAGHLCEDISSDHSCASVTGPMQNHVTCSGMIGNSGN